MFRKSQDDRVNRYIRERVRQARQEAKETQDDLAKVLEKNRVAVSDLERGRVSVSAADLSLIAAHYSKPVSFFFPPLENINKDDLSTIEEEILILIHQLPSPQQHITLENIRQQVKAVYAARGREYADEIAKIKGKQ